MEMKNPVHYNALAAEYLDDPGLSVAEYSIGLPFAGGYICL